MHQHRRSSSGHCLFL